MQVLDAQFPVPAVYVSHATGALTMGLVVLPPVVTTAHSTFPGQIVYRLQFSHVIVELNHVSM